MAKDPCSWTVTGHTDCETPIWQYGCTGGFYPGLAPEVCPNCGRPVDTSGLMVVEIGRLGGGA